MLTFPVVFQWLTPEGVANTTHPEGLLRLSLEYGRPPDLVVVSTGAHPPAVYAPQRNDLAARAAEQLASA